MNTKDIGNISETRFLYECAIRGTGVSVPIGDNLRYDAIVDISGKLLRIQVKTMRKIETSRYEFSLKSINWNSGTINNYKDDVDYFFAFNADDCVWVLVPICDVGVSSFRVDSERISKYGKWFS